MKTSPLVIASGLAAVAAGGFFVGRISSSGGAEGQKTAEVSRPDRARPGDRSHGAAGAASGEKDARGPGGRRLMMTEKLEKMEAIMRGENPLDRSRALLALIDQLAPGEFEDVVAKFRALGITQNRLGEYSMLLSAWAKVDPLAALEYAKVNTQGGFASNTVLATWASIDPEAALRWAQSNHDGKGDNPYLAGVIRGIAETNPDRATEILKTMAFGEQRGEALAGMMQHILKQGPEASRSWIMALEDEQLRNGAMVRMSEPLADIDPKGTAEWLMKNPGEAANRRLDDVYERWAGKDLDAALASIASLPKGDQKTNALSGVVSQEASTNPKAALALMNQYQGDVNDGVVRDFVRNSFDKDPQIAAEAISRIADERQRNETYQRTLWRWLETDMAQAQTFIQNNALPESVTKMVTRRVAELQKKP
ncbi:MAG TPA: hypothetical protein VM511_01380 [Luteolibacter sp.]|nr:hypothetical protein [Luteolibacter sp.]